MSRWDWDERHPRAPKKPPPAHGIRMQKAGKTWWGQRWIEALEHVLQGDAGRLARGKTYARAGRAHDLVVHAGSVTAQVTGSRATPYDVKLTLAQLSDASWQRAIGGLAEKAQFAAELLAGQMPKRIDEVFVTLGASLFPQSRADLMATCSCPDSADPCKHIAATHYLLGEAFDADPFLLFELRGRSRERVLAGLRASRAAGVPLGPAGIGAGSSVEPNAAESIPRVQLGPLEAEDYDRAREPLPALQFSFEAPEAPGALLRQLGLPGAWHGEASPAELLSPLVARAAEAARRIALADEAPAVPPPESSSDEADAAVPQASSPAPPRRSPRARPPKAGSLKAPRPASKRPSKRRQ
jgi:uncharacterized Zn finger protein